jgi:hypothetical protein
MELRYRHCRVDKQQHAFAVDVGALQPRHLGDAQTRAIGLWRDITFDRFDPGCIRPPKVLSNRHKVPI